MPATGRHSGVSGTIGGRKTVLGAVAAGNFAQLGARMLLSPVVPLVLLDFGATKGGVGLALTGMWAVYALVQFPSGVLADRHGERTVVLVGLGATALGSALVALAPSVFGYGLAVLVLGGGTGLFFAPASSLLSRLFRGHGGALGALTAGGAVAGVVFPAAASIVGVRAGWRPAVALGAVVALPTLAATYRLVPATAPVRPDRTLDALVDLDGLVGVLARPAVAYTVLIAVLTGFTFQAVSSFFPTFLVEHRGLDTAQAGLAFAAAFALSSVAQPLAGRLSDATSRDTAIAGSVVLTATGIAVLLAVPGRPGLLAGTAALGAGISWPGSIQARFMDQLDDDERGFGFGLSRTAYMLLAAPGSGVVGALADASGWPLAYGVVAGLLVVCLAAIGTNRLLGLGL